jgi:hypothetical protein
LVFSWSEKLDTVGVFDQILSEEYGKRESREGRESDDDERFLELAKDNGRVSGYDGTSGISDILSGLPRYWVVGLWLVASGSGGSGARNGTEKLRDGALRHREKNGVKYPRTTTTVIENQRLDFSS